MENELTHIRTLFQSHYDVDGHGWITTEGMASVLRVCNSSLTSDKVNKLFAASGIDGNNVNYDVFLTWLWKDERERFLEEHWMPFVNEMRSELLKVKMRKAHGFTKSERMPSQEQFLSWGHKAITLTEQVRGKGNGTPNVVFQVLMRMAQFDGVAPYRFEQVPTEWSKDGFVRVVDGVTRGSFYSHGPPSEGAKRNSAFDEFGNLKQNVAESAISNTKISNVMTKRDATMLVVGTLLRGLVLKVVMSRQRRALCRLIDLAEGPERELLSRMDWKTRKDSHVEISVEQRLKDIEDGRAFFQRSLCFDSNVGNASATDAAFAAAYEAAGVHHSNVAGEAFLLRGGPIRNYGQLPPQFKLKVHKLTEQIVNDGMPPSEFDQELEEFVFFLRNHPGGIWKGDRHMHRELLLKAQFSGQVAFVNPDRIEKRTQHRFLPIRWFRTVDLFEGMPNREPPALRRSAGQREISRIRKNAFAYDDEHGLGLCSPANDVDDVLDVSRMMADREKALAKGVANTTKHMSKRLGQALVTDVSAKLGNWFLTDIEKIVTEFAIMNVRDDVADEFLPGEAPIMVGQNPRAASSIGATQHTQMSTASVGKWLVFSLRAPGRASDSRQYNLADGVRAQVELVQIGDMEDSIILRVETTTRSHAAHPAVVKLLCEARKLLMLRFGGRDIDFNVFAAANVHKPGAVLLFTPISCVAASPKDNYSWVNPDTQEKSSERGLPVQTVDFSQGKGNWMVWGSDAWEKSITEGRSLLGHLYDFTRKPGVRQELVAHLQQSIDGWVDVIGKAESHSHGETHVSADDFWDAT